MSTASKVIAQTDRHTDRNDENITSTAYMGVTIVSSYPSDLQPFNQFTDGLKISPHLAQFNIGKFNFRRFGKGDQKWVSGG